MRCSQHLRARSKLMGDWHCMGPWHCPRPKILWTVKRGDWGESQCNVMFGNKEEGVKGRV